MARCLSLDYPLIDTEDGRMVVMPDGRAMKVDFERIHEMAQSGALIDMPFVDLLFIRYLCGPVTDD